MAVSNPVIREKPSIFWQYNRDCYAIAQSVVVRRQTDTTKGVTSLAKLLQEMATAAKARTFTRAAFLAQFAPGGDELLENRALSGWNQFSGGGEYFDFRIAEHDLGELLCDRRRVKDYVDRHIVHSAQAAATADVVTIAELDQAIDDLGELFRRYAQVLKAAHWDALEPALGDWQRLFSVPWVHRPTPTWAADPLGTPREPRD
jgi:hypothetical protein